MVFERSPTNNTLNNTNNNASSLRPLAIVFLRHNLGFDRLFDRRARFTHSRAIFQRDVVSLDVENFRRVLGERRVRVGVYAGESCENRIPGRVARERSRAVTRTDQRSRHGDVFGDDYIQRGIQLEICLLVRLFVVLEGVSRFVQRPSGTHGNGTASASDRQISDFELYGVFVTRGRGVREVCD